jgi:hypothetical protein
VDRTLDSQVAYYNLLDGARHLRHAVARALVPSRLARHAPATALWCARTSMRRSPF